MLRISNFRTLFAVLFTCAVTIVPSRAHTKSPKLIRTDKIKHNINDRSLAGPEQFFLRNLVDEDPLEDMSALLSSESEDPEMSLSLSMPVVMDPASLRRMLITIEMSMSMPMSMSMSVPTDDYDADFTFDKSVNKESVQCNDSMASDMDIVVAVDLADGMNGVPAQSLASAVGWSLGKIYETCNTAPVAARGYMRDRKLQDDGDLVILGGGGVTVTPLNEKSCLPSASDAASCTIAVIHVPLHGINSNSHALVVAAMDHILTSDEEFASQCRATGIVGLRIVNEKTDFYGFDGGEDPEETEAAENSESVDEETDGTDGTDVGSGGDGQDGNDDHRTVTEWIRLNIDIFLVISLAIGGALILLCCFLRTWLINGCCNCIRSKEDDVDDIESRSGSSADDSECDYPFIAIYP